MGCQLVHLCVSGRRKGKQVVACELSCHLPRPSHLASRQEPPQGLRHHPKGGGGSEKRVRDVGAVDRDKLGADDEQCGEDN